MLTKLLLASSAIGALSAPVANYQHTTQEGNVNITYQYETNEVNSVDDIVIGNVYHFEYDEPISPSDIVGSDGSIAFLIVNGSLTFQSSFIYLDESFNSITLISSYEVYIYGDDTIFTYTPLYSPADNYSSIAYEHVIFAPFSCDIVFIEIDNPDYSYFTASDYNVITNVQEVYHTGLFGNLADFLRYYVYGGIPHVTDISFEVGNQTITMLDWLVTTTSIALAILCIFLLYHFFRWVFKLVSGLIILR